MKAQDLVACIEAIEVKHYPKEIDIRNINPIRYTVGTSTTVLVAEFSSPGQLKKEHKVLA